MILELHIQYDLQQGRVAIKGPLDQTVLILGALAEATRLIERIANKRDDAAANGGGPKIVVAQALDGLIRKDG